MENAHAAGRAHPVLVVSMSPTRIVERKTVLPSLLHLEGLQGIRIGGVEPGLVAIVETLDDKRLSAQRAVHPRVVARRADGHPSLLVRLPLRVISRPWRKLARFERAIDDEVRPGESRRPLRLQPRRFCLNRCKSQHRTARGHRCIEKNVFHLRYPFPILRADILTNAAPRGNETFFSANENVV